MSNGQQENKNKWGGVRPGQGRPRGRKNNITIEKQLALKHFEKRVLRASDRLITAQIHLATGQTFLYKIEKERIEGPKGGVSYRNKKPEIVTSQLEIQEYLEGVINEGDMHDDTDPGATYYYLTAKEPNNMALDSLMNRVHGRPKETLDLNATVTFSLKDLAQRRKELREGERVQIPNTDIPNEK